MGVARADHAAVASKRPDREKFRVTMIAKVEHTRKTGRGELQLRPEAIRVMATQQIVDAACDGAVAHLACRHETEQCPSRLGGSTRCLFMTLVVECVAVTGLAPTAVCVLGKNQPVDGASDLRRTRTYAGSVESAQDRPRPVDVIYSPTSVPAAVVFLASPQKLDRCRQRGPVRFFAELCNHAHAARRHV